MRTKRLCAGLFALCVVGGGMRGKAAAARQAAPQDPELPVISLVQVEEAPVIDGKLDDPCWEHAARSKPLTDEYGYPVHLPTTFQICQKDDVLYLAIRCPYDDQRGGKPSENTKHHDGAFWMGESIEFMLDLDMDETPGYYRFALTTHDVTGDWFCPQPGDGDAIWEPEYDVKSVWTDEGWTIEYALPLAIFDRTNVRFENFSFNLFRIDAPYWDIAIWSPIRGDGFNFPHRWGEVRGLKGRGVTANEPGLHRDPFIRINDRVIRAGAQPSLVPARKPDFVKGPTVKAGKRGVAIAFEVNTPTDVAVWIEDETGERVRHLAAGLLGPNAPPPLRRDSLKQDLVWDHRDDRGERVGPGAYRVKVGLHAEAGLDRVIGWDPSPKEIQGIAFDAQGRLVVVGGIRDEWLDVQRFASSGEYLDTVYPPSAAVPPEKLKGLNIIDYGPDGQVRFGSHRTAAWLPHLDQPMPHTPLINSKGQIIVFGGEYLGGPGHFYKINADGSLPDDFVGPYVKEILWTQYYDQWAKRFHFALDPDDENRIYLSGIKELHRSEYSPKEGSNSRETWYNAVLTLRWGEQAPMRTFLGRRNRTGMAGGSEPGEFVDPQGIAFDNEKNLWVCDRGNNRIQIFSRAGEFVRAFDHPRPYQVCFSRKTGHAYVMGTDTNGIVSVVKYAPGPDPVPVAVLPGLGPESYWRTMALNETGARAELLIVHGRKRAYQVQRVVDTGDAFSQPEVVIGRREPRSYERVAVAWDTDIVYAGGRFFDGKTGDLLREGVAANEVRAARDGTWATREGFFVEHISFMPASWATNASVKPIRNWQVTPASLNRNKRNGFSVAPNGDVYVARFYQWQGKSSGRVGMEGTDLHMAVDHYAPDGKMLRQRVIYELSHSGQAPVVDIHGNIYVVDNVGRRIGELYEPDIAANLPSWFIDYDVDWDLLRRGESQRIGYGKFVTDPLIKSIGTVYKFGPGGGGLLWRAGQGPYDVQYTPQPSETRDPNAGMYLDWGFPFKPKPDRPATHWSATWITDNRYGIFPRWQDGVEWEFLGVGPAWGRYNKGHSSCCCQTCRIAVDDFGRVFAPACHRSTVRVIDAAGNEILRIGRYGNMDSYGPDSPVPDPGIAMRYPSATALSKRYLYVTELRDTRILKIKLGYEQEKEYAVTVR
jgi:hypothetical protein